MLVLLLLHAKVLFVAFVGETVATSCEVYPNEMVDELELRLTPVTATVCAVIAHVAVLFPSAVVTVIVAVPAATPVTNPALLTVAALVLLLVQVKLWFVAFVGVIVAVS